MKATPAGRVQAVRTWAVRPSRPGSAREGRGVDRIDHPLGGAETLSLSSRQDRGPCPGRAQSAPLRSTVAPRDAPGGEMIDDLAHLAAGSARATDHHVALRDHPPSAPFNGRHHQGSAAQALALPIEDTVTSICLARARRPAGWR